jgi:hypothetical protein
LEEDDDEDCDSNSYRRKAFNTFALQQIVKFDTILSKACRICMLDELDIEER